MRSSAICGLLMGRSLLPVRAGATIRGMSEPKVDVQVVPIHGGSMTWRGDGRVDVVHEAGRVELRPVPDSPITIDLRDASVFDSYTLHGTKLYAGDVAVWQRG